MANVEPVERGERVEAGGKAGPVDEGNRVLALDVVRGFAVLGILLVNIELFRGPEGLLAFGGIDALSGTDAVLSAAIRVFAEGKFLTALAFLFGLGFAFQAMRSAERGGRPRLLLARRLGGLALFGLAHAILIWSGDFLLLYALLGPALLLFVGRRPRTLAVWASVLWAIPFLATLLAALLALVAVSGADAGAQAELLRAFAERAEAAYTSGSYPQMVAQRLRELAIVLPFLLASYGPVILAMMLLGGAVARSGWLSDLAAHRSALRRVALVGAVACLPLNVFYALLSRSENDAAALAVPALVLGAPLLALGYASAVALAAERFPRGALTRRVAAVGRLALTNYLAQSLVMTGLFYGFGLYGSVGLGVALMMAVGLMALQLMLSPLYLQRFDMGPAEWLWRRLTYGKAARTK